MQVPVLMTGTCFWHGLYRRCMTILCVQIGSKRKPAANRCRFFKVKKGYGANAVPEDDPDKTNRRHIENAFRQYPCCHHTTRWG